MMALVILYVLCILVKVSFVGTERSHLHPQFLRLTADLQGARYCARHHSSDKHRESLCSWSSCQDQAMSHMMGVRTGKIKVESHPHRWINMKAEA